eukprot:170214_1
MSDMSGDIRPTLTEREINVCCRPYGIHKEKCLTSEESKKLHPKLKLARTIELKAGDKYFLYCIKRKCRNKSLKHAELIKARAYSEHLKEFHAKEPFDGYENEILIFSHWTISQDKKQYVKEYVLLDVVSSDGYRYVMVPKNRSPFNMQTGYEYSQVINIEKYQEQLEEKNQEQLEEKNPEEQQVIEDYLPSANEWVSRKEYEKVISMLKHILKCVDKTGQMHIDDYMGQKSIASGPTIKSEKLEIKSPTFMLFVKNEGKRKYQLIWNNDTLTFVGNCVGCKDDKDCRINYEMTIAEASDRQIFHKKKSSLLYHFNKSNIHKRNINQKPFSLQLIKSGLVMKIDMIYDVITTGAPRHLFERMVMIIFRQKRRYNCKKQSCFPLADYLQGVRFAETVTNIFFGVIISLEKQLLAGCKTAHNIVFLGCSLDSYSHGTFKSELQIVKSSNQMRVRVRAIGMKKFKYSPDKNVKSLKDSLLGFKDSLKRIGAIPTDIKSVDMLYSIDTKFVLRNFCGDGVYFAPLIPNPNINEEKQIDEDSMMVEQQLEAKVPAINQLIKEVFNTTIFLAPSIHDTQHKKGLAATDAWTLFHFLMVTQKWEKKAISVLSDPKWFEMLLSLFEKEWIRNKPKKYAKESQTRYRTHYTRYIDLIAWNYEGTRYIMDEIAKDKNMKAKSKKWRRILATIFFIMHIILYSDWGNCIDDSLTLFNQKYKYSFVGSNTYQWEKHCSSSQIQINKFDPIKEHVDVYYVMQFFLDEWEEYKTTYTFAESFSLNPRLRKHFDDLLKYKFAHHDLTNEDYTNDDIEDSDFEEEQMANTRLLNELIGSETDTSEGESVSEYDPVEDHSREMSHDMDISNISNISNISLVNEVADMIDVEQVEVVGPVEDENGGEEFIELCGNDCKEEKLFRCSVCQRESCLSHLNEAVRMDLVAWRLPVITLACLNKNDRIVCTNCIENIKDCIDIQAEYEEAFIEHFYGVNKDGQPATDYNGNIIKGRVSKEYMQSLSDWSWRIVCIDYLLDDIWETTGYDKDDTVALINKDAWLEGKMDNTSDSLLDRFKSYHMNLIEKANGTVFESIITKNATELIYTVIHLKKYCARLIAKESDMLREYYLLKDHTTYVNMKSDKSYRKKRRNITKEFNTMCVNLWRGMKQWILQSGNGTLRLLYDMEMGTIYKESIVETMGSGVGYLLSPNIKAKTLEKKLLLYLSLAKEDALSEQLVIKCAQIYLRKFNRDGILKKKRSNKSSIEFSKVIDKWLRYIDEGIFTLHAEDIQIIIQLNCDEVQIYK